MSDTMQCRWWQRHPWGPWSEPSEARMTFAAGSFGDTATREVMIQQRACDRCNKIQTRSLDGR